MMRGGGNPGEENLPPTSPPSPEFLTSANPLSGAFPEGAEDEVSRSPAACGPSPWEPRRPSNGESVRQRKNLPRGNGGGRKAWDLDPFIGLPRRSGGGGRGAHRSMRNGPSRGAGRGCWVKPKEEPSPWARFSRRPVPVRREGRRADGAGPSRSGKTGRLRVRAGARRKGIRSWVWGRKGGPFFANRPFWCWRGR